MEKLGLVQNEKGERSGMTVAYLRVSTEQQARDDKFGLSNQRAEIQSYCAVKGIAVDEFFIDTYTGYEKESREALGRLRQKLKAGTIREVLCYDSGRIGRDQLDCETLWREFQQNSKVTSVTEHFTDDDNGILMRGIKQLFHQHEGRVIKARMLGGKIRAVVEAGRNGCGWGCLGYRSTGNGQLVIIPEEQVVVVALFEFAATAISQREIARALNREGHRTMTGKKWDHTAVYRIIHRYDFYAARRTMWECPSEKVAHEAILSQDLCERYEASLGPQVPDGLVTASQAEKELGISRNTAKDWARRGLIEAQYFVAPSEGDLRRSLVHYDRDQLAELAAQRFRRDKTSAAKSSRINPPDPDVPEGQVTVKQASAILGVCAATVRSMIESGKLDLAGIYQTTGGVRGWLLSQAQVEAAKATLEPDRRRLPTQAEMRVARSKRTSAWPEVERQHPYPE